MAAAAAAPKGSVVTAGAMPGLITAFKWGSSSVQMLYVTMVYGPIAAYLVELFPTSIRYTSMSLPYHLGNGWFGGFLPLIATAVTTSAGARDSFGPGAIYTGLIYPIAVCVMTVSVGGLFIRETKDTRSTLRSRCRKRT